MAPETAAGSALSAGVVELHSRAGLPPARVGGSFVALRVMGRDADGNYTPGWTPPNFTVDENGKIVGYVNE